MKAPRDCRRFLVTGGAGFIGSAFIRELLLSTPHEVLNVDVLTYAGNPDNLTSVASSQRYRLEIADICDASRISELFETFRPEIVVHFAAESHVDRSIDRPAAFLQTNVTGTYTLLEAARRFWNGLADPEKSRFRLLHVSTDEVYGDLGEGNGTFIESDAYAPSSPYSASKAASDHLVRAWCRTYGLPIIVTHSSNNYGPFQFPEKLIPHMVLSALDGKPLPIYGRGNQVRDWLYVEDHARALVDVALRGRVGETYNIGGSRPMRNLDVVGMICDLLDEMIPERRQGIATYRDRITFVKDRPGHDVRYAIDSGKIEREMGWSPHETFESGLGKTISWYLENTCWWEKVLDGSYRLERIGA